MNTAKERKAIEYLKLFEPPDDSYYLCYSGGKDSDVIRILAQLAGVRRTIEHNLTTVDAPETIGYVKSIPEIHINYPKLSMWKLIVKNKMPPTRLIRYCCSELKERGGKGKLKITGVRKAESTSRKKKGGLIKVQGKPKTTRKLADSLNLDYETPVKSGLIMNMDNDESRRFVEGCYRTRSTMINPIIDWTDDDVWEFLEYYGCKSNPLYEEGFNRVGCIGCPMSGKSREKEFKRWPKYKKLYINAFDRMLKAYDKESNWKTGEEVFDWWLYGKPDGGEQLSFLKEFR
ncbi:MAG: phosphoadenosine phosphosulfate reductase family protein [Firmicutes bacterium]|nr:phosphoadenosine phosphosulfate reductase family protein [Bacillota bacterium]